MKKFAVLFCVVLLMGCSSYQVEKTNSSFPVLLEQTELPQVPQRIIDPEFRLIIKLLVDEKGKVAKALLLSGSGLPDWDSLAINSIKKWKYEPARLENKPVSIWFVQKVKIQYEEPCCLMLSQIVCDSYDSAIVVVKKLNEGIDFGELATKYSCDSSKATNGFIGKRDVLLYPAPINRVLKRLAAGQHTEPIEYGKRFVIFKRNKS